MKLDSTRKDIDHNIISFIGYIIELIRHYDHIDLIAYCKQIIMSQIILHCIDLLIAV